MKNKNFLCQMCARLLDQNFSNVEVRGRIFSSRADSYATLSITLFLLSPSLSLSLSLSLQVPTRKYGKTGFRGSFNFFSPKPAPTEPSRFTQNPLVRFGFPPMRTIRTKHEWIRVLVFLFSAPPPSFFVTLTTEPKWRGVSVGERIGRHSGNTQNSLSAIGEVHKLLPAWVTILGQNGPKAAIFSGQKTPKTEWLEFRQHRELITGHQW